ncbi:VPLPA-CTERM sorting domain-containing protein [Meridianimarinicoccus sp. RP-17]|uniref:VPLPA-CTERM sorting domain-containing protein n=1 Tax=Meridianimarinicoccus zhengii TaxID=2056810 RepID=UPI000DAD99D3|nr:VPLPA-CTERM sorting domain-containing protein [Phycocomes zhengii]
MKALRHALVAISLIAGSPLAAASITAGYNPAIVGDETVGLRFRGPSTGGEVFIGQNDLGVGSNRSEANVEWPLRARVLSPFVWTFDSLTGVIEYAEGPGAPLTYSLGGPLDAPDVIQMTLSNRSRASGTFGVNGLTVNGEAVANQGRLLGFNDFMITDFAVMDTLTIAGTFEAFGQFDPNDSERVRLEFRASTSPAAIPVPAALPLMGAGIAALAMLQRRKRG